MAFCGNCGTKVETGDAFCPSCGSAIQKEVLPKPQVQAFQNQTPQNPATQVHVIQKETVPVYQIAVKEPVPETEVIPESKPKRAKGIIIGLISCFVVIALLSVGAYFVLAEKPYEKVAEKFAMAAIEVDYGEVFKSSAIDMEGLVDDYIKHDMENRGLSYSELLQEAAEGADFPVENIEDVYEYINSKQIESIYKKYGEYKISSNAKNSQRMELDEVYDYLEEYENSINFNFDIEDYIDFDEISDAYCVEVEITIDGSMDEETFTRDIVVIEYDGNWKPLKVVL